VVSQVKDICVSAIVHLLTNLRRLHLHIKQWIFFKAVALQRKKTIGSVAVPAESDSDGSTDILPTGGATRRGPWSRALSSSTLQVEAQQSLSSTATSTSRPKHGFPPTTTVGASTKVKKARNTDRLDSVGDGEDANDTIVVDVSGRKRRRVSRQAAIVRSQIEEPIEADEITRNGQMIEEDDMTSANEIVVTGSCQGATTTPQENDVTGTEVATDTYEITDHRLEHRFQLTDMLIKLMFRIGTDGPDSATVFDLLADEWMDNSEYYRATTKDLYDAFDAAFLEWLRLQQAVIEFEQPITSPPVQELVQRYLRKNALRAQHDRWTRSTYQVRGNDMKGVQVLSLMLCNAVTMSDTGDLSVYEEGLKNMDERIKSLIGSGVMGRIAIGQESVENR